MPMTDAQFHVARRMFSKGMGLQAIANELGIKRSVLRARFRREDNPYRESQGMKHLASPRPEIPVDTQAEWEARLNTKPRDLTAAFCGDPLPGFSALERKVALGKHVHGECRAPLSSKCDAMASA